MRETLPWGGHAFYDRLVASRLKTFYTRIADQFPFEGDFLDIGCGPGQLAAALHRLRPDARVVGMDLDPVQVKRAQRNHPDVDYRVGDSGDLPFGDASMDRIIATESFHHWAEPEKALEEMHRVLRPGGQFWIVEGAGDQTRDEYRAWTGRPVWPGMLTVARIVFTLHGYTTARLEDVVLPLVDASPFGGAEVDRVDGWWMVRMTREP